MGERYYMMPMLDGYSEVFRVASSLITGSKAQTYDRAGGPYSNFKP